MIPLRCGPWRLLSAALVLATQVTPQGKEIKRRFDRENIEVLGNNLYRIGGRASKATREENSSRRLETYVPFTVGIVLRDCEWCLSTARARMVLQYIGKLSDSATAAGLLKLHILGHENPYREIVFSTIVQYVSSMEQVFHSYWELANMNDFKGHLIDAFLGPADAYMNDPVAELLSDYGRPLVLWSSSNINYNGAFDSPGAFLGQFLASANGRRLGADASRIGAVGTFANRGQPPNVFAAGKAGPRLEDRGKHDEKWFEDSVAKGGDLPSAALLAGNLTMRFWRPRRLTDEHSWKHVFDVNLPDTELLHETLDILAGRQGLDPPINVLPESFLFGFAEEGNGRSRCSAHMEYLQKIHPNSNLKVWTLSSGSPIPPSVVVPALNPDIFIFCGDPQQSMNMAVMLRNSEWYPKAIIFDSIAGSVFYSLMLYNTANFIDVLPAPPPLRSRQSKFLGTFGKYVEGYRLYSNYAVGPGEATYPFTSQCSSSGYCELDMKHYLSSPPEKWWDHWELDQIGIAIELLLHAFTSISAEEQLEDVGQWLIEYLRTSTMVTIWGDYTFGNLTKPQGLRATIRQFMPINTNAPSFKSFAEWAVHKGAFHSQGDVAKIVPFYAGDLRVVSSEALRDCRLQNNIVGDGGEAPGGWWDCDRMFTTTLMYPMTGWYEKYIQRYRCAPGCKLDNHVCYPCPLGKARAATEMRCSPCAANKFTSEVGAAHCTNCMTGADCSQADAPPISLPGYYRVDVKNDINHGLANDGNLSAANETNTGTLANYECTDLTHPISYSFVKCASDDVCLGGNRCSAGNTGFRCNKCLDGYAHGGLFPGTKHCGKCNFLDWGYSIGVVLIYLFMIFLLADKASEAAAEPGKITYAVLRMFVHYYHIVGAVLKATELEAELFMQLMFWPSVILTSPLDVMRVGCGIESHFSIAKQVQGLFRTHMQFVPWGVTICVVGWLLALLWRYNIVVYNAVEAYLSDKYNKFRERYLGAKDDKNERAAKPTRGVDRIKMVFKNAQSLSTEATEVSKAIAKEAVHKGNMAVHKAENKVMQHGRRAHDGLFSAGRIDVVDDPVKGKMAREISEVGDFAEEEDFDDVELEANPADHCGFLQKDPRPQANRRVIQLEEMFNAIYSLRVLGRYVLVWFVLTQGQIARSLYTFIACEFFEIEDGLGTEVKIKVLVEFNDIECESAEYEMVARTTTTWIVTYHQVLPVLMMGFMYFMKNRLWDVQTREFSSVLLSCYEPPTFWWELVLYVRTILMWHATLNQDIFSRIAWQGIYCVFFAILHYGMNPYERTEHNVLNSLDRMCSAGVLLLLTAGLCVEIVNQDAAKKGQTVETVDSPMNFFGLAFLFMSITFNLALLIKAFLCLTFNSISLPLQAIIESGSYVSYSTYFLHSIIRFFKGFNPMYYVDGAIGLRFIDVSNLAEFERRELVTILTETFSACIDCSDRFRTWLVENAIHEGFTRALNARSQKLRRLYNVAGMHTKKMSTIVPMMYTMRPPDIPAKPQEVPKKALSVEQMLSGILWICKKFRKTTISSSAEAQEKESLQQAKQVELTLKEGVTVQEIDVALRGVNVDILERHPRLHRKPRIKHDAEQEDDYRDALLSWDQNVSLAQFIDNIDERNEKVARRQSMLVYDSLKLSMPTGEDDHLVMCQMEEETMAARNDYTLDFEESNLRRRLFSAGEEIQTLQKLLGTTEANNPEIPYSHQAKAESNWASNTFALVRCASQAKGGSNCHGVSHDGATAGADANHNPRKLASVAGKVTMNLSSV